MFKYFIHKLEDYLKIVTNLWDACMTGDSFCEMHDGFCIMYDTPFMMHDALKLNSQAWRLPSSNQYVGCMHDV